jgi:hypothetical protein
MEEQLLVTDISGMPNINELYEASLIKKWIKLIPMDKLILLDEYNRKEYFIEVADIVLDNDEKKQGTKKTRHQKKKYTDSIYSNNFKRRI